jgi:hypothetical protein
MRVISFLSALVLASAAAANAWAADLTRIERTIAKEPAYKSRPQYCLLVFGPEARTRVWLVRDGDVLYVDRNGNGNLTEKGKRVASLGAVGDITERDRGTKHAGLTVTALKDGGMVISITTEGKYRQRSGRVTFATRSQDAPIVHFNGPASVRFSSAVAYSDRGQQGPSAADMDPRELLLKKLDKQPWLAGKGGQAKAVSLGAVIGTPGLGEGTFVTYKARDILGQPNRRIVVEAAFPNQDAKAKPIVVEGFLQPDG